MVRDWPGADEGDVRYGGVGCEVVRDVGPADDGLNDVWRVAASLESACRNRREV